MLAGVWGALCSAVSKQLLEFGVPHIKPLEEKALPEPWTQDLWFQETPVPLETPLHGFPGLENVDKRLLLVSGRKVTVPLLSPDGVGPQALCFQKVGQGSGAHTRS